MVDELTRLDGGDRDRPVPMPYADLPLDSVLPILVMEAGVHTNDLLAAFGHDEPLPEDVTAASVSFLVTFAPLLAAQAAEVPSETTVVRLSSPGIDLRLSFAGGTWSLAGPGDGGDGGDEADVAVHTCDDSTLMLYALGRVDRDDARLGSPHAARQIKAWIPGP